MTTKVAKFSYRRILQTILVAVLFWTATVIFLKLAEDIFFQEPIGFDAPISRFIIDNRSGAGIVAMKFITNLGSPAGVTLLTFAAGLLLLWRKFQYRALFLVFTVGSAGVANLLMKLIFQRARPDVLTMLVEEKTFSFPSGHAMGSAALAVALITLFWHTKWRWPVMIAAGLYTFLVGFSRVYLGVHYPSDVVAGWSASLAWVILVYKLAIKVDKHIS